MADIRLGNDNTNFKVGSGDCSIYLGTTLLYSGETPPTPPTFQGKWIATYSDSTTSSAECDSTSAITDGEIEKYNIVSVEIGDCVTSIGNYVFNGCTGITSCTIGSGVTSIGNGVFIGCYGLTSIDIPNSVTSIGMQTFQNCSSLTSIDIPNSVTSIGNYVFNGCTGITSCTIGSGVTSIGIQTFYNCRSITSIDIPNSVTSIGAAAFASCTSLTSITVNAITPPTLANVNAFDNTNDCAIYVPSASVNAYKSASGWSDYADRIQAIS